MNINITVNTVNQMFLVVDDMVTISSPVYLWRIYNDSTKEQFLIELSNETGSNPRYDRFDLDLPNDLDLERGRYRYYVYESSTPGDEDYENMNELANGILTVETEFDADTYYEPTGTDTYYTPQD